MMHAGAPRRAGCIINSMRSLGTLYAAAVTPLTRDDRLDLDAVPPLLAHLHAAGCDGAVLAGTTGEGPSLTLKERTALLERALAARPAAFRLVAGTGCNEIANTLALTRRAFELGADGVLVLPPYFYRKPTDDGLRDYFRRVIREAVPTGARILLYHVPQVTGIAISNDLLAALLREFPDRLLGVKDSQGDRAHTLDWCRRFRNLNVFVGHDQLLADALGVGAAGAILASANVFAPLARRLLDAHSRGADTTDAQARLDAVRTLMDTVSAPPAYKALLAEFYGLPAQGRPWPVRLPLVPLSAGARAALATAAQELMTIPSHD